MFPLSIYQTVTYWHKKYRTITGELIYDDPKELKVRWEYKQMLYQTSNNHTATSNAIIYSKYPMDIEDYIFLGKTTEKNPLKLTDAYKINRIDITYTLKPHDKLVKVMV
ncbi:hypothetical protein AB832_07170 [Flavobacteriaceae bacterium (ex Bugula neritina AB1)]|nr:hypothetical protein AB832_07170 [Flavobacteriaceae bacterium (ex Bugula neritina AB1)]